MGLISAHDLGPAEIVGTDIKFVFVTGLGVWCRLPPRGPKEWAQWAGLMGVLGLKEAGGATEALKPCTPDAMSLLYPVVLAALLVSCWYVKACCCCARGWPPNVGKGGRGWCCCCCWCCGWP